MIRALLAAALLLAAGRGAHAAEIRVLTAGAFKPVLLALAPTIEQEIGEKVLVQNDTAGGVASRVANGEAFDIAVLTPATAEPLLRQGKLTDLRPVASVGIGLAVKTGTPRPDIGSVPAFKAALLAARSIAIVDPASGGTSGIYLMNLFDRLGIGAEIRPKLVLVQGGLAAERVASGEADMAIQQQSELVAVPGVQLAGLLPDEVQNRTVYVAGLNPAAGAPARALLASLTRPEAAKLLAEKGLIPP